MSTTDKLNANIEELNKKLEKQISFKRNIGLSIVKGAAGAIGATIVAGIIIAILAWAIRSAGGLPYVGDWLNNVKIQSPVDSTE